MFLSMLEIPEQYLKSDLIILMDILILVFMLSKLYVKAREVWLFTLLKITTDVEFIATIQKSRT